MTLQESGPADAGAAEAGAVVAGAKLAVAAFADPLAGRAVADVADEPHAAASTTAASGMIAVAALLLAAMAICQFGMFGSERRRSPAGMIGSRRFLRSDPVPVIPDLEKLPSSP